ncbi:MAG: flagellin [Candidatus Sulfotelmatobacter sp.]
MPLGILYNIPSLAAESELTLTSNALNSTLEQLSSGSRINTGSDDAAGLAIANGLQANVSALTQSVSNANNGIGELQLADGALAQVTTLLNRAVTLATESGTGTVSDGQRVAIQAEYSSILTEINSIGTSTTFNSQAIFQGGSTPNTNAADSPGTGTLQLNEGLTAGSTTTISAGGAAFTFTAAATGQVTTNQVTSAATNLATGTAVASGAVLTVTRTGGTTVYTASAATTVGNLIDAINTGTGTGITVSVTGTQTSGGLSAVLAGGALQINDLDGTDSLAVAETNDTNANEVQSTTGALTASTAITAGTVETVLRNGVTTTYTAGSAATIGQLITALTTSVASGGNVGGTTGIVVGGTTPTSAFGAALVGGFLQISDPTDNNSLTVTESVHADLTVGPAALAHPLQDFPGGFANPTATTSTVQDLINAINSDTVVGAKASLINGILQVTDPFNRGNLAVTTTDTVLGAAVAGAQTSFVNPTIGSSAPNANELVSNAGTSGTPLTTLTALAAGSVTSFTAGGKTFSYTSPSGGSTIGDLISAIDNPLTDPADLQAYIGTTGSAAGQLVVVDPLNNGNLAVGPTNANTALGTFTSPVTTGSPTTNIFLSDSTAVGSSEIAVTIGSLNTASITNGSGTNGVDLAATDLNTQGDAQSALILLGSAIANIASVRGNLGAVVNRLTAASNVLNSQVLNLTSAESTITSADIPTVVANLTKYSILEQTGISALAQSNQQQQLVLKLLQ